MRKIIALLLTVLMVASALAAIPASAAAAKTYDDTTKDTDNKILITEIARNISAYTRNSAKAIKNVMNFVEIYNNSDAAIDLDTLSLLLAVEIKSVPTDAASRYLFGVDGDEERLLWKEWRDHKRFLSEMEIKSGAIVDQTTASLCNVPNVFCNQYLKNQDVSLAAGKSAAIWFVTAQTLEWMTTVAEEVANFDPKTEFLKFYYGNDVNVEDYTVVMVWAYSDYTEEDSSVLADDMFNFEYAPATGKTNENYIIGVAENTWNVDNDAAYTLTDPDDINSEKVLSDKLYGMSVMGFDISNYTYTAETSIIYAPASTKPFVQNASEKFIGNTTSYTDYFDAGLVRSYREGGVISWACAQLTPGNIPEWHQLMINSAKEELDEAELAKIDKYIVDTYKYVDNGENTGRNEDGIGREYNFETQEEIKNRFNNSKKKDTTTAEEGLPTLVIVLIIVGAVLVVAGGACAVVFLVILPKKKAAAAASVSEPAAEKAPAEETTPVEETPAEEKKDE